jgi:hypothetical protein
MRDIKEMAKEAGLRDWTCNGKYGCLEAFAALVRADKQALAAQPAPPECQTEAEKTAFAFGWWQALESVRQPAVPDAMRIANKESFDYREGWNDCRALMLEMMKARKP